MLLFSLSLSRSFSLLAIQLDGMASLTQRRLLAGAYGGRAGRRLARTGSSPRASASSSGRSRMVSSPLTSPASGSSSRELAYARWAATASSATHRATKAVCAAGRRWAGTAAARCRASRRKKVAASPPKRPATSTPMTARRQRRAHVSRVFCAMRRCSALVLGPQKKLPNKQKRHQKRPRYTRLKVEKNQTI